ncbi:MAG: FAD-dependent oxidoreductase, partial [Oscillospiraceae bacterium]|nr:FAD-dependent oxidoreductase [Oscillospiraceae bacterium]
RTLVGTENDNIAAAGRCISVTQDMWDITRVIPTAAVTGQAAGLGAALAAALPAGGRAPGDRLRVRGGCENLLHLRLP